VIKAKQLKWKEVKPEVFEVFAFNAEIAVLKIYNGKPAYYQINNVSGEIGCQIWVGNKGFDIRCHLASVVEGKRACQEHYNSLIRENIDESG